MNSFVNRHKAHWKAYREQQKPQPVSRQGQSKRRAVAKASNHDELMQIKLSNQLNQLSLIRDTHRKDTLVETQFLPDWNDYLNQALKTNDGSGAVIVVRCMIWSFNTGAMRLFIKLANYALQHDCSMPDEFSCDVKTFLCRSVGDWALKQLKAEADVEPYLSTVFDLAIKQAWDLPKQVKANLYKAKGLSIQREHPKTAYKYFAEAKQLWEGAGVTNLMKRLDKTLSSSQGADNNVNK